MLKSSAVVTRVVRACVKDSLKPKMAQEGKLYYTVVKRAPRVARPPRLVSVSRPPPRYAEGAKEVSRETYGTKE